MEMDLTQQGHAEADEEEVGGYVTTDSSSSDSDGNVFHGNSILRLLPTVSVFCNINGRSCCTT